MKSDKLDDVHDILNINGNDIKVYRELSENPNDAEGKEAHVFRFYLNDNLLATISVSAILTDMAFLYEFNVNHNYRGKGYGTEILKYILKKYRVNELSVNKDNTRAINLYKRFGFKPDREFVEDGVKRIGMKINLSL